MIIYLEACDVFLEHVRLNRIEAEIEDRLKLFTGRRVSPAEVRSWRNSLMYVSNLLRAPQIPVTFRKDVTPGLPFRRP